MNEFVFDFTDENGVRILFFGHDSGVVTVSSGHSSEDEIPTSRVVSLNVAQANELAAELLKWSKSRAET
jgi:hypothetical protein